MALVDPAGQAWPAVQGPEHWLVPRLLALPYRPAGHAAVQVEKGSPGTSPYLPAGQGRQAMDDAGAYWPAGQGFATPEVLPGGHV